MASGGMSTAADSRPVRSLPFNTTCRVKPTLLGLPKAIRAQILNHLYDPSTPFKEIYLVNDIPVHHPLARTCTQLEKECLDQLKLKTPLVYQDFIKTSRLHVDIADFDFTLFNWWAEGLQKHQGRVWDIEKRYTILENVVIIVYLTSPAPDVCRLDALEWWLLRNKTFKKNGLRIDYKIFFDWKEWTVEEAELVEEHVHGHWVLSGPERHVLWRALVRAVRERKEDLGMEVEEDNYAAMAPIISGRGKGAGDAGSDTEESEESADEDGENEEEILPPTPKRRRKQEEDGAYKGYGVRVSRKRKD